MPFDPKGICDPRLAYIRVMKSEAAASLHPKIPLLALGQHLFGLHAADGTLQFGLIWRVYFRGRFCSLKCLEAYKLALEKET